MVTVTEASGENCENSNGTVAGSASSLDTRAITELATKFQKRSDSFRTTATAVLIPLVILSLAASVWVFTSVADVVSSDWASLQSERNQVIVDQVNKLTALIAEAYQKSEDATTIDVATALLAPVKGYQETIAKLQASLISTPIDVVPSLVQVNVTRFVTLAIIFFGISLFTGLYRYYLRLSVFYQSRADALYLLLVSGVSTDFTSIAKIMTPSIDFGKSQTMSLLPVPETIRKMTRRSQDK